MYLKTVIKSPWLFVLLLRIVEFLSKKLTRMVVCQHLAQALADGCSIKCYFPSPAEALFRLSPSTLQHGGRQTHALRHLWVVHGFSSRTLMHREDVPS